MYPVTSAFHTLATQNSPKTRIRIYSFNPAVVDCTDDNDVTTNGRLIRLHLADTDSNSRIADSGVTFNYFFNKDENISIGECVSSQIEFTLLNFDGALNGIRFKQAKAYLDVWDSANSAWVACPMGVYILEQPTRTRQKLVGVTGFDQMQLLDAVADSWWNSIDWTGSKTLEDIITLMATQLGLHVSASLSSHLVNGNVYFTSAPFTAVQTTYKDIVHYIAEMTGTVAYFDRNGAFDMKWFSEAQISGSTVTIDTDSTGNGCFGIDISEISVAQIDGLSIFNDNPNKNVTVGTGTNPYSVYSNPLYNRLASVAVIQTVAGRVKDRIITFPSYSPITLRCIYDWSLDAGDIINVVSNTDTYVLPIMQQTLTWRGGYVVAEVMSCGKAARPSASETQRNDYQTGVNFNSRVTFTDLSTAGNTTIDGGNITTGTIDASVVNVTNLDASNITAGTMSANKISGGTLTLGGQNNTNGTLVIKDSNNNTKGTIDNTGANIYGSFESNGYTTHNHYPVKTSISNGNITTVLDANGTDTTLISIGSYDSGPGEFWPFIDIYGEMDGNSAYNDFQPGSGIFSGYDHYAKITRIGVSFVPSSNQSNTPSWYLARSAATFNVPVTINDDLTVSGTVSGQGFYDLLLGVGTEIAANSSCDSLKSPGKYTCATYTIAQSVTNTPFTATSYALFVIKVAVVERLIQVAIANSSSCTIKLRQYNGTNWNAWKTINPA